MKMRASVFLLSLSILCVSGARSQVSDVSLPKQRDSLVESATKLWAERGIPLAVPDPAPNPFQFPAETPTESAEEVSPVFVPVVSGAELLNQLASRIPASGTVFMGGNFILLLGQKRLKVGDSFTISFEGKNYDLSLEAIGSTTFTVRLGSFTHTRATYISSSSRP